MNRPSSHFSIIVSYIFLFYKIFSLHFYLFCISLSFSSFYLIAILHNFYYILTVFLLLFSQLFISLLLFFSSRKKDPGGWITSDLRGQSLRLDTIHVFTWLYLIWNYFWLIAAWAAASLAIGTRNGEQET